MYEISPDVLIIKFVEDVVIFENEPAVWIILLLKIFDAQLNAVDIEKVP